MRIFAIFDAEGLPKGFYTPVVHSRIPEGAVCISKEQWHEFITHQGRRSWDGENVVEYIPASSSKRGAALGMGQGLGLLCKFHFLFRRSKR